MQKVIQEAARDFINFVNKGPSPYHGRASVRYDYQTPSSSNYFIVCMNFGVYTSVNCFIASASAQFFFSEILRPAERTCNTANIDKFFS